MRCSPAALLAGSLMAGALLLHPAHAGELAVLSVKTWEDFVPKGKEVDAIYGDIVLRNDKIVVVIANPVPGRHANMTVRDVGGSVIDLTLRDHPNDQLSAYYPGARRFPYQLATVSAQGHAATNPAAETARDGDNISLSASNGKLPGEVGAGQAVLRGDVIALECLAPATVDRPEVRLTYTLREGQDFVEIRSEFRNTAEKLLQLAPVDDFRADRTFQSSPPGETDLVWAYDKWWGQAYGVVAPETAMRLSGSPAEPRVIEFLSGGKLTRELAPSQTLTLERRFFAARDLIAVRAAAARLHGDADLYPHRLAIQDARGEAIRDADVQLLLDDKPYGHARTNEDGQLLMELPPGRYQIEVQPLGRSAKLDFVVNPGRPRTEQPLPIQFPAAPRVVAEIRDADGKPIPCKVQFVGVDGTPNPYFFHETGEHAVHNLYYAHDGRFTQEIPAGTYDVLVSYGPEYDAEKLRIVAKAGEDVPLRATLRRVVQSPGWVSADFHSHSSPSGDNVSSQRGRVLNHLCEQIEFAPCTEHNRLDTYVPHLKALGVEDRMGTCTGMELTSVPGTVNHQNAFPLVMKPRTQDNGAPERDLDPEVQIRRLALWDNKSDKLVQQNHPDMGEVFFDRDGDGVPDGGFKGMFEYQDVIEVHPHWDVLSMQPFRKATDNRTKITLAYNNSIFNWLQLLNQGRRIPGVVNSDAHYNFHGVGWIRNYVKCATDDPPKIDPLDIVHAAEHGHIVLTNGPYLEVTLLEGDATAAAGGSLATPRRQAIPGDEIALPGGYATLHVRVQCPNWFDIDRVQVLQNGRKDAKLNWTRSSNADAFSKDVVRFERRIPLEFREDTHVIVVATGENLQLGPIMGPEHGRDHPTAISNPIYVDADGGGFKPNGDTLGHPLPVKGGKKVEP